jgi:hypothetical protein
MIAYSGAGGMAWMFIDIFFQNIPHNSEKCHFRTREEILPYATSYIKEFVIGDIFLVFTPDSLFTFLLHLFIILYLV